MRYDSKVKHWCDIGLSANPVRLMQGIKVGHAPSPQVLRPCAVRRRSRVLRSEAIWISALKQFAANSNSQKWTTGKSGSRNSRNDTDALESQTKFAFQRCPFSWKDESAPHRILDRPASQFSSKERYWVGTVIIECRRPFVCPILNKKRTITAGHYRKSCKETKYGLRPALSRLHGHPAHRVRGNPASIVLLAGNAMSLVFFRLLLVPASSHKYSLLRSSLRRSTM